MLSYDAAAMADGIERASIAIWRAAPTDRLPRVTEIVESERLARFHQRRRRSRCQPRSIPTRACAIPRGSSTRSATRTRGAPVSALLARFQLFHTPPATPMPRRTKSATTTTALRRAWLEYKRVDAAETRGHRGKTRTSISRRGDGVLSRRCCAASASSSI